MIAASRSFPTLPRIAIALGLALAAFGAGAQWIYRAAPDPFIRTQFVTVNAPPGTNHLVVAAEGAGLFRAVDGPSSTPWMPISSAGLPTKQIRTFATPTPGPDLGTMWVGTEGFGLYSTSNGGASWQAMNGSAPNRLGCFTVRQMIVDFANQTMLVGTACTSASGVWKTTDMGASWTRLGGATVPADAVVTGIASTTPFTTVTIGTSNYGVLTSTDSGATWTSANTGLPGTNPRVSALTMRSDGMLYTWVQGSGFYVKGMGDWTGSRSGLPEGAALLGQIFFHGQNTIFVGLDGQGVFRSTDSGINWSAWGSTGTDSRARFTRTVRPIDAAMGKYYLFTQRGVLKTLDGGATFSSLDWGLDYGHLRSVLHDRDDSSVVYGLTTIPIRIGDAWAADYDTVYSEIGTGITGTTVDGMLSQDWSNHDVLYATTNSKGVFKSTNRGASWSPINTGLPSMVDQPGRLRIDSVDPSILYLGSTGNLGIYKSTDGGANWAASSTGLTTERSKAVSRVSVHPTTPSLLYAATGDGLYKSTDSGATWSPVYTAVDSAGTLLPVARVRFNPANSSQVYIATNHANPDGSVLASSGVLRTTDGGANWTQLLSGKRVEAFEIFADGKVWAGLAESPGQPALLRSVDGGANWAPWSAGLKSSDIAAFGATTTRLASVGLEDGFYTDLGGAVSTAPAIEAGPAIGVSMHEDGSPMAFSLPLTAVDFEGDSLTWSISAPATSGTAGVAPSSGTSTAVTYTPAADFIGGDSFEVQVSDGLLTDKVTVFVNVMPVNDAPMLDAIADPAPVPANSGAQSVGLTGISPGPSNEAFQVVWGFITNVSNPSIFGATPVVSITGSTGEVTYGPGGVGASTITVRMQDNGGTLNGGVDSTTRTFTVTFTEPETYYLVTVDRIGTGTGHVVSGEPAPAIDCGIDCSHSYLSGTMVTLTAFPDTGSVFDGWTGCDSVNPALQCIVTVYAARNVTASFPLLIPPSAPRSGFNGDARSDVLWRNTTSGLNYQWQMNGLAISGQGYMSTVPSNWTIAGIGDLDGNSISDVFWREAGGLNYVWMVNALAVGPQGYLPTVPNPWVVLGLGDASGDGKADVFWRNPTTGQNYLWIMNAMSIASQGYLPTVAGTAWEAVGVADYNGDTRADVLWRNKTTGQNYLWLMNGLAVAGQGYLPSVVPVDWEAVGSPDANADGKADVLWRHKITGQNYLWLMNGLAVASQGYLPSVADANWKVVGFGDYNGDGRGDVLWRNGTTGQNYLWILNGIGVASQGYLPSVSGANWVPVK